MRFWNKASRAHRRLGAGVALVALSAALHAAVLGWAQSGLGRDSPQIHGERLLVRAVQVSQVSNGAEAVDAPPADPVRGVAKAQPAPVAPPMQPVTAAAVRPEPWAADPAPAPPPPPPEARAEDEPPPAEVESLQTNADPTPQAPSAEPPTVPIDGVNATHLAQDYHPGRELTRRPQLLTPITLDLPIPDFRPDPTATLRMRLLIGADGGVDHVLIEASTLDPLARDAAIKLFKSARYAPGEIQGEAVRSQVLIEVGYSGR